jgi:acetyltransferase-like isoleucine patch superfamily enzyme
MRRYNIINMIRRLMSLWHREKIFTRDIVAKKYKAQIGEYTYGRPIIMDWNGKTKLSIGKFCSFANDVVIMLGGNHRTDWITTYPFPTMPTIWTNAKGLTGHPATKGDIAIGNDVWIGSRAIILSGVTIGDGCVIGAGAVVARSIPPYSVVVGNPAKVVKKRFSAPVISKLIKLQWWNWNKEKINKHSALLCSNNYTALFRL